MRYIALRFEIFAFSLIGLLASTIHFVSAIIFIERIGISAWIANLIAFGLAFPISLYGHSRATFSAKEYGRETIITGQSARRFFILAFCGAALNEMSVILFVEKFDFDHRIVLILTIGSVAVLIFFMSKFWAFVGSGANNV